MLLCHKSGQENIQSFPFQLHTDQVMVVYLSELKSHPVLNINPGADAWQLQASANVFKWSHLTKGTLPPQPPLVPSLRGEKHASSPVGVVSRAHPTCLSSCLFLYFPGIPCSEGINQEIEQPSIQGPSYPMLGVWKEAIVGKMWGLEFCPVLCHDWSSQGWGQGIATSVMFLFIWKFINSFMKDSFIA